MHLAEAAAVLTARRVDLVLTEGIPAGVSPQGLREIVPYGVCVVMLCTAADPAEARAAWDGLPDLELLSPPYGDRVMSLTAKVLRVPVRHYIRVLIQMQVHQHGRAPLDAGKPAAGRGAFGFSNDLSASGVLIETRRELALGSQLDLSFLLPGAPGMTRAKAVVVREARCDRAGSRRYGMRFLDLGAEDRATIISLQDRVRAPGPAASTLDAAP